MSTCEAKHQLTARMQGTTCLTEVFKWLIGGHDLRIGFGEVRSGERVFHCSILC
jgi:hypothetical protein